MSSHWDRTRFNSGGVMILCVIMNRSSEILCNPKSLTVDTFSQLSFHYHFMWNKRWRFKSEMSCFQLPMEPHVLWKPVPRRIPHIILQGFETTWFTLNIYYYKTTKKNVGLTRAHKRNRWSGPGPNTEWTRYHGHHLEKFSIIKQMYEKCGEYAGIHQIQVCFV